MGETWKDVLGLEGKYQVSDQGRVKSLDRVQSDGRKRKGRIMSQSLSGSGYPRIAFRVDGKNKNVMVHRLVATHFIPNPEGLEQVNHVDGNKLNPKADNLEWVTSKDNIAHAWETGLCGGFGENHHNSKLSDKAVEFILENPFNNTHKELGELFNVTQSHISRINRKETRVRV